MISKFSIAYINAILGKVLQYSLKKCDRCENCGCVVLIDICFVMEPKLISDFYS